MFSLTRMFTLWIACLSSLLLAGQECSVLQTASAAEAADYLHNAGDDAAAAACIQVAFHQIAVSPPEQAIPLLIKYLGYKRPLKEGERHGIFMHGNGPNVMYPAVHELYLLGRASEPAVLGLIAENKNTSRTEAQNALYTLLLIHHGNALSVVQELHKESTSSKSMEAREHLQAAARVAAKWCDEQSRAECEDELR